MSARINPGFTSDNQRQFIRGFGGELIDVTMMSRPDTNWVFVDSAGHEHRWYEGEQPATNYSPMCAYYLPSLVRITDSPGDDEYPGSFHYECRACRASELAELTIAPS